jgi:hypothetical protein
MNKIVFPVVDDYIRPDKLLGLIVYGTDDTVTFYNVHNDSFNYEDTPWYRNPVITIAEALDIISLSYFIVSKKTLYKLFPDLTFNGRDALYVIHANVPFNSCLTEVSDMNLYPFYLTNASKNPLQIAQMFKSIYRINSDLEYCRLKALYPDAEYLIRGSAVMDSRFNVGDTEVSIYLEPFTKSWRFKEMIDKTISKSEDVKLNSIDKEGATLIKLDFDGAHLRVLDKLSNANSIPTNQKAVKSIIENISGDIHIIKADLYKAMYSERFDIDHVLFKKTKRVYQTFKSPFGIPDTPFNYIIQQHEVLNTSKLALSIDSCVQKFLYYTYDGLYVLVNSDYVDRFFSTIQKFVSENKTPLTVTIKNKEFFIHD